MCVCVFSPGKGKHSKEIFASSTAGRIPGNGVYRKKKKLQRPRTAWSIPRAVLTPVHVILTMERILLQTEWWCRLLRRCWLISPASAAAAWSSPASSGGPPSPLPLTLNLPLTQPPRPRSPGHVPIRARLWHRLPRTSPTGTAVFASPSRNGSRLAEGVPRHSLETSISARISRLLSNVTELFIEIHPISHSANF